MAAKAKASDEGTQVETVAEQVPGTPVPAAEPEQQQGEPAPAAEASTALTTTVPPPAPETATGLPVSQFQDHAHIAITLVQIKRDELQSSFNQVKAEMDGSNQAHEATMAERRVQFETEQNRTAEMHAENQDKMKKLLENLEIGITTLEAAISTYNNLMKPEPEIKNIRDDERQQQESEQ